MIWETFSDLEDINNDHLQLSPKSTSTFEETTQEIGTYVTIISFIFRKNITKY